MWAEMSARLAGKRAESRNVNMSPRRESRSETDGGLSSAATRWHKLEKAWKMRLRQLQSQHLEYSIALDQNWKPTDRVEVNRASDGANDGLLLAEAAATAMAAPSKAFEWALGHGQPKRAT